MKLCISLCYPQLSRARDHGIFLLWRSRTDSQNIVKLLEITIHTVCCEDGYFPQGKFKLFNSLFDSVYLVDLFAVRYLWVVCNEDKCCVVTKPQTLASLGLFTWLVYVRTYCVSISTLNQNKRTRLLYLGDAQIIRRSAL